MQPPKTVKPSAPRPERTASSARRSSAVNRTAPSSTEAMIGAPAPKPTRCVRGLTGCTGDRLAGAFVGDIGRAVSGGAFSVIERHHVLGLGEEQPAFDDDTDACG